MARIKINLPLNSLAVIEMPVRITDINYGNHLGNDSLVGIVHEARVQWLDLNHLTEMDIGGAGLIMSDLAIEYIRESFYKDILHITIFVSEITSVSFELYYQLEAQRGEKILMIAKAKTGMVCYNYEQNKVCAIPASFKMLIENSSIPENKK